MTENDDKGPRGDIHEVDDTPAGPKPPRVPDAALDDLRLRAAEAFALQDHGRFADYVAARSRLLSHCDPETILLVTNELQACRARETAPG